MSPIRPRSLWSLTVAERQALLQAVPVVLFIRFVLWRMPLATALRLVRSLSFWHSGRRRQPPVDLIAWAVGAIANRLPRTTCLPRALATQLLLGWHGHWSVLRIGLRRDWGQRGPLADHAWVEFRGRVVIGALDDLHRFQRLPPLPLRALPALIGFYGLSLVARMRTPSSSGRRLPTGQPLEKET